MALKAEPLTGEERREARRAALLRRATEAIVKGEWICRRRDKKQAGVPEGRREVYEGCGGEKIMGRKKFRQGKPRQDKPRQDKTRQ
jgi:hypothetical protein